MKKLITLTLVLAILMSLASCGTDNGGTFGLVSQNPEPNSEAITHSDPTVDSFIKNKITFLNKVYPDGNIPEDEREIFGGIAVVPIYTNPYFEEMSEDYSILGDYAALEDYLEYTETLEQRLLDIGIEDVMLYRGFDRTPAYELRYPSYSQFAETDLPLFAADESGFFKGLYVYSMYSEPCMNSYVLADTYTSAILEPTVTASMSEYIRGLLESEYAVECLDSSAKSGVIPSVKKLMEFYTDAPTDMIPELGGNVLSEWTLYGCAKNAVIVNAADIYENSAENKAYLIYYLAPTSGVRVEGVELIGMELSDGSLKMCVSVTSGADADMSGNPFFIIELDKSKLPSDLDELTVEFSYNNQFN